MTQLELVLFTNQFPYGIESEPFLEAEISILAERFDRVLILPSATRDTMRPIPPNIEVVTMRFATEPSIASRIAALGSPQAARTLWWSLRTPLDLARHLKAPRKYVDVLGRNILKYRELRQFIQQRRLEDAVFYDFWLENTALALALLRRDGVIRTAVARAHNFEVFGVEYDGHPPPFRQAKAAGLDAVLPTSLAARAHLEACAPATRGRMHLHRLGVLDPGVLVPEAEPDSPPLIVTCAILTVKKRVHLVPEALARLDMPFRWVHIGDGPEMQRVVDAAERHLPAGSWEFVGQIPNHQVRQFYREHPVLVLLSLSESEGEPVSMMEALSYGVPVVACDVGGIRELVSHRTGVLLTRTATPDDIAAALRTVLVKGHFDASTIKEEWRSRYDATTNYTAFATTLLELHHRTDRILRTAQI